MKLKYNPITIRSTKNISKKDIFKRVLNNNYASKKKLTDVINYRNFFLNENQNMWKTFFNYYNNNETPTKNIDIYSHYNIHKSIINLNNIKEKQKTKKIRQFHSAFLLKKVQTINYENKSKKSILPSAAIGKENNLFLEKNKENKYVNDTIYINLNSSKNLFFKQRDIFNISTKFFKLNKESKSSIIKEKNKVNKNNIALVKVCPYKNKRNKNDLIPYPFKRMQNKIRKYFSFSRNVRLSEEQLPYFYSSHLQLNNAMLDNKKNNLMINESQNINNGKSNDNVLQNNNNEYNEINKYKQYIKSIKFKNKDITKKEDKSINTEYSIFNKNIKNKTRNEIHKNISSTPLFNNQLIASKTSSKGLKFFITTSTNKNQKDTEGEGNNTLKRSILVYKFK